MASARASALALLLAALPLHAQSPPTPPADLTVSGIVVNAATGAPIPRALIVVRTFHNSDRQEFSTLSASDGAFRIDNLPPGDAALSASRPGFYQWPPLESRARFATRFNSSRLGLRVALRPYAVVAGRVTDSNGDPVASVEVSAVRRAISNGRAIDALSGSSTTDDRGIYRIPLDHEGPFIVGADSGPNSVTQQFQGHGAGDAGTGQSFAPVYYPNAPTRSAAAVLHASAGQEIHADLTLQLRPAFPVRGRLIGFLPHQRASFRLLLPTGERAACSPVVNASTGEFSIRDVLPGAYTIDASQIEFQPGGYRQLRAELPIQVAPPGLSGLAVSLSPTLDVTARLQFSGAGSSTSQPPFQGVLRLAPVGEGHDIRERFSSLPFNAGGVLAIKNVPPGSYRVEFENINGLIESIRAGDSDLLDNPILNIPAGSPPPAIDIQARRGMALIAGHIAPASEAAQALVIAVPRDHPGLPVSVTAPNPNGGAFALRIPALGAYTLYAWRSPSDIEYLNPSVLQSLGLTGVPIDLDHPTVMEGIELSAPEIHPPDPAFP